MNDRIVSARIIKLKEILSDEKLSDIEKFKAVTIALFEKYQIRTTMDDWQVQWMRELRAQGFSLENIGKIVNTGITTVRSWLVDGEKDKMRAANIKHRRKIQKDPIEWRKYLDYQARYARERTIKRREALKELEKLKEKDNIPKPISINVQTRQIGEGELKNENENEHKTGSLENS